MTSPIQRSATVRALIGSALLVVSGCGGALALIFLGGSTGASGATATFDYEYYRDVYGNGKWGWSKHGYPNYTRAVDEASRACRVGTNVRYIGKFDGRGNLVQRWDYRCR